VVGSDWDFFISYTKADRAWAEWIAWALEEDEHHILVRAWDSGPGSDRVRELRAGTRDATRTIAVLSSDYLNSVYGGAEWHAAWAGDPEGVGRKLLTVRVADCYGPDQGNLPPAGRADLFGLSEGTAMTRLRLMASAAIAGKLPRVAGLDRDTREAIAEQLDRLPLALEQAAAWLDRSGMPGLEYLDLLRHRVEPDASAGSGASGGSGGGGSGDGGSGADSGPIAVLWDISADRVGAESPAAVQLLSVCACLASEPVPLDLFTAHAELLPEPLSSAAADPPAFADVLAVLTGYALATTVPVTTVPVTTVPVTTVPAPRPAATGPAAAASAGLQLHHLMRSAVRARDRWPSDSLALALWLLRIDAPAGIHGSPRSWPRWAALVPHVLAAVGHVRPPLAPAALEDTAWLLDRAAAYLHVQGRLAEAKALHERALILDEALYGPDHPAVAMRLDVLAHLLRDLGQLE
jgi:hypothetical protein